MVLAVVAVCDQRMKFELGDIIQTILKRLWGDTLDYQKSIEGLVDRFAKAIA